MPAKNSEGQKIAKDISRPEKNSRMNMQMHKQQLDNMAWRTEQHI